MRRLSATRTPPPSGGGSVSCRSGVGVDRIRGSLQKCRRNRAEEGRLCSTVTALDGTVCHDRRAQERIGRLKFAPV
jgi:hypothetical protein